MEHSLALLFVQVALGALIGGFMALEIGVRFAYGSYFWSLGAFLGGFVAYWSVDFKEIIAGIAHSYRRTISWRPDRPYWRAFFWLLGGTETVLLTICATVTVVFIQLDAAVLAVAVSSSMFSFFVLLSAVSSCLIFDGMPLQGNRTGDEYALLLKNKRDFGLKMMLYANPIGVLYWLAVGLRWLIVRISSAVVIVASAVPPALYGIGRVARVLGLFIAGVFIYVHSERRTRRLVYATLGAMVGYMVGSVIIGAAAGGVLAVASYKLTPVRWLKIVPATRPQ